MAADAVGCTVPEIAKSIAFTRGDESVVVVISGDKRVDPGKLSKVVGGEVMMANASRVRKTTGYVIGGVPPFPHDPGVKVLLDSSLQRFNHVWAAAGTPSSVMNLSIELLASIVGGEPVDVAE